MAKETLSSNNNMFEVTSDIAPVTSKTINSGFNNEKKNFTISFRSKKNQPTTIGTLSVTAAENKRFLKSPRLVKSKKNNYITNSGVLRKKLKTVTKDSDKNITSYTYDLIYTAFENTTIGNPAIYDITNRARAIVVRDSGIRNVEFGKDYSFVMLTKGLLAKTKNLSKEPMIAVKKIHAEKVMSIYTDFAWSQISPYIRFIEGDV